MAHLIYFRLGACIDGNISNCSVMCKVIIVSDGLILGGLCDLCVHTKNATKKVAGNIVKLKTNCTIIKVFCV